MRSDIDLESWVGLDGWRNNRIFQKLWLIKLSFSEIDEWHGKHLEFRMLVPDGTCKIFSSTIWYCR